MNSFATMSDIENEAHTTCQLIKENYAEADDETLYAMMSELSSLACNLNYFADETDEWTCFEACQDYRANLQEIYEALGTMLDDSWLGS